MSAPDPELARLFTEDAARRFRDEYLPRLAAAVEALPPEKVWWRPHDGVPSVGSLLRHLEGNVRQWILGGLGGETGARERRAEFEAPPAEEPAELVDRLRGTVTAACAVIEGLDDGALRRRVEIQGFPVSGVAAVAHVVEHFGWHLGQIVWIAKAVAGSDHGIAFYDDDALEGR